MRNTKKFEVDLATALSAHDTREPAEMTLNELLRAYDARHCKAEVMRLKNGPMHWGPTRHGRSQPSNSQLVRKP